MRGFVLVFSSNIFLFIYLPAVLLLYYICPRKARNLLLFAVSLFFYAWGEPVYLFLMVFTILLNFVSGTLISKERSQGKSGKGALAVSVVLNLSLLAFFKYAGFLVRTVNVFLPAGNDFPVPDIPLPIGISFYIFQSMSYTIDVYRREVDCQKNFISFGAYVSMFPQLIAGPIVRYRDVAAQLESREETVSRFSEGVCLFVIGLAKKVLIANKMGALWESLKGTEGTLSAWVCMFAYTLQIYYDFSGYSDMAIGLGKMFGFEFLKNFDYPYISKSITEFWRRWHISLSTWFREYVYIPLGGNRKGKSRQLVNIFIVWALTGLWHGASWNFVAWGLYYGVLLTLEKLFLLKWLEKVPALIRQIMVLLAVSFGWVLFSFTDLAELGTFLSRFCSFAGSSIHEKNLILAYLPLVLASFVGATPLPAKIYHKCDGKAGQSVFLVVFLTALMILCTASLASQSYNPFIYFRF